MNDFQKIEAVKLKANQIEQKAMMKEKLLDVQKYPDSHAYEDIDPDVMYQKNVEQTIAVNEMYIDAIQAKLKILDKF